MIIPGFYYPGAQQTDQWGRFRDAYRLIIKNKDLIINYTYELMIAQFPSLVVPNADKCKRDLGKFIDAVARDTHSGGNVYGRKFTMQYFDSNSGLAYISSEIAETRWAYEKAKDLMLLAITNQLSGNYGSGNFGPAYNEISVGGSGGTGITIDPANPYGTASNTYGTAGSNTTANDLWTATALMSSLQLQLLGHILMKLLEQVTWMTCLMNCSDVQCLQLQNSHLPEPNQVSS